jgi:predicted DsbA family dithiol-disulfide isomerase
VVAVVGVKVLKFEEGGIQTPNFESILSLESEMDTLKKTLNQNHETGVQWAPCLVLSNEKMVRILGVN